MKVGWGLKMVDRGLEERWMLGKEGKVDIVH